MKQLEPVTSPPDRERTILHVDMDAFFASVEVLDDPSLAGKPVIVGGSGERGVVASCTYEARRFGVRSAMPSVRARRLCPHAIFIGGHYARYSEMSGRLLGVLRTFTPLVEPIGLDEAFLDVTGARRLLGPPDEIAAAIRRGVHDELSLHCSIGIGSTKLIAKLASRAAKPVARREGVSPGAGVVSVPAGRELAFLHPLPVEAIWGVGPATASRLHSLGIRTVGEMAALDEATVARHFGKAQGAHLAALSRGIDGAPVVAERAAKSVGHEETFNRDLYELSALQNHASRMAESVAVHLRGAQLAGRTVSVKVRFADFTTITRSHTLHVVVDTAPALAAVAAALLEGLDVSPGVRLLGVSASGLRPNVAVNQLVLPFPDAAATDGAGGEGPEHGPAEATRAGLRATRLQTNWHEVSAAVDAIRARFGRDAVGTAAMVRREGIQVPDRHGPWGPSADPDGTPAR